jgi:aldehyde dehydrogenase
MAVWKLAPALAAGNCVVIKPAEQTTQHHLVLMELLADILPPGVVMSSTASASSGQAARPEQAHRQDRIYRRNHDGPADHAVRVRKHHSGHAGTRRQVANIFFADVMDEDDDYFDKCLEGFAMFALNQGEVCTCPSRALVDAKIYDKFMDRALKRVGQDQAGTSARSIDHARRAASNDQVEKILSYFDIGKKEGAKVLTGGKRASSTEKSRRLLHRTHGVREQQQDAHLPGKIFGPVVSVAKVQWRGRSTLDCQRHAVRPRRAGVDPQRQPRLPFRPRNPAGRVWTNCYHLYPAHAAFGGYKQSGIGRENHLQDARPLPADQEPDGQLFPKALGFF